MFVEQPDVNDPSLTPLTPAPGSVTGIWTCPAFKVWSPPTCSAGSLPRLAGRQLRASAWGRLLTAPRRCVQRVEKCGQLRLLAPPSAADAFHLPPCPGRRHLSAGSLLSPPAHFSSALCLRSLFSSRRPASRSERGWRVPSLLCSTPWAASCSPPRPADGPPALHSGDSPRPPPQRSACSALTVALVRTAHSRRSDTCPAGGGGVCRLARRPLPCCSSASPPARRGSHWETWGAVPLPFTPVPPLGVPSCGRACWHLAGHPAWCGHTC